MPSSSSLRDAAAVVRFAPHVADMVRADSRRIVVVGAGGWIGRSAIEMLHAALGADLFDQRVACFGSSARTIVLAEGAAIAQEPLARLANLAARPSLVLHLAFLTKDKVADMDEAAYTERNRAISDAVAAALDAIGADRLFVASSGAAAFADDEAAAYDLRMYGSLKRADEERFARWADAGTGRRAAIGRLYAVSGPFINKPETYALADLILQGLAGNVLTVRARSAVWRSYVAVRELVSLVFAVLLEADGPAVTRFDTGGQEVEMGTLAQSIAKVLGAHAQVRRFDTGIINRYVGDHEHWLAMLDRNGLEHLGLERQIAETSAWLEGIT